MDLADGKNLASEASTMARVVVAIGFLALLAPITAHAAPISIEVLSATYSTTITLGSINRPQFPYFTNTAAGSAPVSQSGRLEVPADDGAAFWAATASASADWLSVSAASAVYGGNRAPVSSSSADFELTFSPLTDGIALIDIFGRPGLFTRSNVSLFDVTADEEVALLWSSFGLTTNSIAFSAAHVYDLHLSIRGSSAGDATDGQIRLSGLVAVPEPSSLLLLSAGLAGVGVFRRLRTRKPS